MIPIPDLQRTDFLLMLGANPLVSHGSVLTAPRVRDQLNAIVGRGGRVVVVDPRRTETARAFEHVAVRPDADAWLLLSLLHVLFDEDLADEEALARATTGAGALRVAAARHPPEATEERTGVPAEDVRALARDLAAADARRGLRPHRLVPGPLRHAGRLPASTRSTPSPATSTAPAAPCSGARRSRSTTLPSRPAWTPTGPSARASATSPT